MPEIFFDDRYFHGGLDSRDGELTRPLPADASFVVSSGDRELEVRAPAPHATYRISLAERQAAAALEAAGYAARFWWERSELALVRIKTQRRTAYSDLIVFSVGAAEALAAAVEQQAGAGPWTTLMRGPDQLPGRGTHLTGEAQEVGRPMPGIYFDDDVLQGSLSDSLTWPPAVRSFTALGYYDGISGFADPFTAIGYAIRMWHEWHHGFATVDAEGEDNPTVFAIGTADEIYRRYKYDVRGDGVDDLRENPAPTLCPSCCCRTSTSRSRRPACNGSGAAKSGRWWRG